MVVIFLSNTSFAMVLYNPDKIKVTGILILDGSCAFEENYVFIELQGPNQRLQHKVCMVKNYCCNLFSTTEGPNCIHSIKVTFMIHSVGLINPS